MRLVFLIVPVFLLLLGGCAASVPAVPAGSAMDPYSGVPDDFSLDVTILAAEDESQAHRRTARYILFPDGTLLHDARPGRGPNTMPGFTRRLSSAQMADVWTDLRKLGLGTSDGSDSINNFRRAIRPKTGHAYLVAVTADGDFWNYTRVVPVGEELDPALTALLRELAVLAWAEDDQLQEARTAPIRYDFGPDPYATYRGTGGR
ncbi:MAG: hypothetical protein CMJ24_01290 [Phycisphaerae bacterium]|nr:hypothetical protein [Phycisphaerae bacterium]MDG1898864.1 hypothetical protein [Phycisphaerales bacterium]|tara:strand:- start:4052 stop:4663 length:612 start_codon:yes stop_codon:yes gene_type:complete